MTEEKTSDAKESVKKRDNDIVSKEIFKEFEKKYCLGNLALLQASSIASLHVKNHPAFSVLVVSPSGTMKSSVLEDIQKIFYDQTFLIASRFTPYGISSMDNKHQLNNRTWMINDMVRTFDTLSEIKAKELVAWMAELMTEGHAGSETAKEAKIEAHMNMIGNLALIKYKDVISFFKSSTFVERLIQFHYTIDKAKLRKKNMKKYSITIPQIKIASSDVDIPKKYQKIVWKIADELMIKQQYEKESMRPDTIVESIVTGHALLNGRKTVNKNDFIFIKNCFENLKRVV